MLRISQRPINPIFWFSHYFSTEKDGRWVERRKWWSSWSQTRRWWSSKAVMPGGRPWLCVSSRWHARPPLRTLPGGGIGQVPAQGDPKRLHEEQAKKSRVKCFIKLVNYNHIVPTRYTLDVYLKESVTLDSLQSRDKKVMAAKETKAQFEERFKTGKNRWLFTKLRFWNWCTGNFLADFFLHKEGFCFCIRWFDSLI